MEKTTKIDNELIAEFMGYKVEDVTIFHNPEKKVRVYFKPNEDKVKEKLSQEHVNTLEYHISWDWLMPVVEKIDQIHSENPKKFKGEDIVLNLPITAPISEVYSDAVEFIKWYSSQALESK